MATNQNISEQVSNKLHLVISNCPFNFAGHPCFEQAQQERLLTGLSSFKCCELLIYLFKDNKMHCFCVID